VLSRDSINAHSPVVVIVPVADAIHVKRVYPSHVHLAKGSGRLEKDSVAKAEQIRAIRVCRIVSYHGRLERDARERIEEAMRITRALN
jgi:mRNA interferase MazF